MGYLFAFLYEFVNTFHICLQCACFLIFVAGSGWLISTFVKDIHLELTALNEVNKVKENKAKLNDKLRELVELHQIAKQLSFYQYRGKSRINYKSFFIFRFVSDFTSISEYIFTLYFLWTTATICDTLLLFQMELVEYSSVSNRFICCVPN